MKKYEMIAGHIKRVISETKLRPHDKLPSLREVADLFDSSLGTVVTAYKALERENIIYSAPKSGYFVLDTDAAHRNIKRCIDFYSGAPDIRCIPYQDFQQCVYRAVNTYQETLFSYSDTQGMPALLEILKKHLSDYQVHTKLENIIVVSGSQQALDILCRMDFPNGKKKILVEQPTYYGMLKSLELCQVPCRGIWRDFDGLNMNQLEDIFKNDDIKFFYTISRYHNPTGQSYTQKEMKTLVRLAEKYNVYLVEDDIAGDFETNPKRDPLYFYDTCERVVYIRSFSKMMMPGLRIAAVVLPPLAIEAFLEYKKWTDTYSSILSQGTLAIYLNSGLFQKNRIAMRNVYVKRMSKLKEMANQLAAPDIEWSIPDSSFFACLKLKKGVPFAKLEPDLARNGIRLMDTSLFFLSEFANDKYYRISVSKTNEAEIEEGITKLMEIFKRQR